MSKTIVIVGTLDTKGREFKFLKEQIASHGVDTLVINTGILGQPFFTPDISAEEVARTAGTELTDLVIEKDRGHSVATMCCGVAEITRKLFADGKLQGIIGMGGGAGTTIASAAMKTLPVGVPKMIISTLASSDTRPYVDIKDIVMMPSIVDISGTNLLLRRIMANAAGAIAGMVGVTVKNETSDKPIIAATMFGVTTPCVTRAREKLEQKGYEVLVFHCTGTGGRSMEDLIRSNYFQAVLDLTTTELADELIGGIRTAGAHRLEAAGEMGIPQIVSAGAIDMVNFGPRETVPVEFKGRHFYQHSPTTTLMRTTVEENIKLGRIVAAKLNRAQGLVRFLMPLRGVSYIDRIGQPFYDAAADSAFLTSLKQDLSPEIEIIEMDAHINDPEFADKAVELLLANIIY